MNINEAQNIAIQLMDEHGLIDKGWYFKYDNAKRRFGVCRYRIKQIGLSRGLVSLNSEAKVRDTILHEIAHVLVGEGHGHDEVWKRKAIEIGCNGQRCYSSLEVQAVPAKYKAVCSNGHIYYKYKIPRHISSCGLCSRKFSHEHILIFKTN